MLMCIGDKYRAEPVLNTLFGSHKSFVEALNQLQAHPKLADKFVFGADLVRKAHGHAMHYLNAYLAERGLPSRYSGLLAPTAALGTPELTLLEGILLHVAVLSLVLKVIYQDYVLEHLTICEQMYLFDDGSELFAKAALLFAPPLSPAHSLQHEPQLSGQISADSAPLSTRSSASTSSVRGGMRPEPNQWALSEPDFYKAKCQYEERLLRALQYNCAFESPLAHVNTFFQETFTLSQLREEPIALWRQEVDSVILNLAFIPLTLWFHPVLLAAAFLAWTRENLLTKHESLKGRLPHHLHGHPWFLFVDSGIGASELQQVQDALKEEIQFVFSQMSRAHENQTQNQ